MSIALFDLCFESTSRVLKLNFGISNGYISTF